MGNPAEWRRHVEEFVLGRIGDPPARVLEVGCGEGELARVLDRAGHRVTAITHEHQKVPSSGVRGSRSSPIPIGSTTWWLSCPCTTSKTWGWP